MASSSSANKVARVAARSGSGSSANKHSNWLFPAAIIAIVVLGVGIVTLARQQNAGSNDNTTPPRAQLAQGQPSDHWHAAIAVDVCGKEQPALNDASPEDPLGIHTHGDGLAHIHPFSVRSGGKNATLGRFFDQVDLTVTDAGFQMPGKDGKVYKEGTTTCGGKAGEVVVAHWKDARTAAGKKPDKIIRSDFGKIRFSENYGAYTVAFVAKGTKDIPAPSSSAEIETLGAQDAGGTSTDQVPSGSVPTGSVPTGSSGTGG